MWMLMHLMFYHRSLRLSSFFFFPILFSIFCSVALIYIIVPSRSFICSLPQLFCSWFLLVYYSISGFCSLVLLSLWYAFLASPPLFSQDPGSSSLSLFWILFLEGCLSPVHLVVFSGVLSCPFIWQIAFCFFILINFLWYGFFSHLWDCGTSCFFCLPSDRGAWGLCKLPDGSNWWWEKLGLALVAKTLLSKALTQLSADGKDCAPSLLVV